MDLSGNFSTPCPKCGGLKFDIPKSAHDDSLVTCGQCGADFKLSDLRGHGVHEAKKHVMNNARKEIKSMLRKAFK